MTFYKQLTNPWLANWPILASYNQWTFDRWLRVAETQVVQIGQLVADLTEELVMRNLTIIPTFITGLFNSWK